MSQPQEPQGASKLLIDLGPLLVFFLVNFLAPVPAFMKIFVATGAFMVAMVAAMLFSAIRYHRISPLLWFSGIMVVILGGLGQIPGAIIGGILIGTTNNVITKAYGIDEIIAKVIVLLMIVAFIMVRPSGLVKTSERSYD